MVYSYVQYTHTLITRRCHQTAALNTANAQCENQQHVDIWPSRYSSSV